MKKALSLFLATLLVLSTMSCLSVVSFAADELTETEVNDTYKDAQEIEIGAVNVGTISDNTDVDWYKFTSDKDYFVVDFGIHDKTVPNDYGWSIAIYDENHNLLKSDTYITESYTSPKYSMSGTVYVSIKSSYGDRVNNVLYDIKATTVEDIHWEDEYNNTVYNNTAANANEINSGETYTGSIYNSGDVDWYKFTSDKDYFVVDLGIHDKTTPNDYGWIIDIYDENHNLLKHDTSIKESYTSPKYSMSGTVYVSIKSSYGDKVDNVLYDIKATTVEDIHWEDEYNNTAANANEINSGETYTGSIYNSDDVDWYKFTSDKDYFVVDLGIHDKTAPNDYGWSIDIYDENHNLLKHDTYIKESYTSYKYPVLGTVYVSVKSSYGDKVDNVLYDIKATTYETGNWETENNNTSTTADVIKQGVVYQGTISGSENDVDFYKFTSTSDAFKLKFSVNLGDDNVDNIKDGWKITVYPADSGSSILEYYLNCNSAKESIVLPYQKGKVYYVKIEAATKNRAPIGELYKFAVVDAAGSNKWEVENGETDLPSATAIANGTKIFGNFFNGDDVDYYKLAIPASGKITVKFNRTESELAYDGWKLLIQDAVGSVIDEVNLGNSLNATVTSKTLPKQGNYYVRIQPNNSRYAPSCNINYSLTVKYTMTAPAITSISNAAKGVSLKWSAVKDCSGYQIYRAVSGGSYAKLATIVGDSKVTYTDTTAANAKKYAYKIIAVDGSYKSAFSTAKAITFLKATTAKAVANTSTGVAFSWTAVPGAKGYEIYRAAGSGSYQKIVTVKSGTVVKYVDKTAKSGTTYKYRVRAYVDSVSKGAFSAEKAIVFVAAPVAKAAASSKTGITYAWTPVTGVTGYQVYRATGSGSFTKIATVKGATAAKYVDKTAKKGVTYKYKVRAYKGSTAGAFSTKVISIKDKY